MPRDTGHDKLKELDALRGIGAVMVFSGHFCEGLVPAVTTSLNGTLLFTALNGPAAVIVFFVLSGFVLTLRPLQARRWSPFAVLALKRWPRLAGPVAVAGLAYSLAAVIGAFPRPAFLAPMLPPHAPAYLFWGQAQHNENVGDVLQEALVGTFLHESARHNGVLWTMHWEFLGSFLAAGVAVIALLRLPLLIRTALFTALWAAAATFSPWLIAFPAGVLCAILHGAYGTRIRIANWLAVGMLLSAFALLSWDIRAQAGIWTWTGSFAFSLRFQMWIVTETVAACLCIAVALYNPTSQRWLASPPGRFAGKISFSFYLVHLLVLCSFSSWLYILILPAGAWTGVGLFVVSIAASLILATPLMLFDQWWIRMLNRAVARPIIVIAQGRIHTVHPRHWRRPPAR
jgi:peptidoglycan/LPS O-acetylase OafA/YrhL